MGNDDGDGDDGGDGDGDGGRIFPGHPGPIPNAPRDNISRKGIPSLRSKFGDSCLSLCCELKTMAFGSTDSKHPT